MVSGAVAPAGGGQLTTAATAITCSSTKCIRCDPSTVDRCTCRCRGANHGLEHEQPPRCGVCGRLIVDQNAIPRPGGPGAAL
jgi:hypothetical protein